MADSSKKPRAYGAHPKSPHCVTIFGAGVAGLTAAHELIERGFRVQVWEPVSDQRDPRRGLQVGGMARTQWAQVDWRDQAPFVGASELDDHSWYENARAKYEKRDARAVAPRRTAPIVPLLTRLYVLDDVWDVGLLAVAELPVSGPDIEVEVEYEPRDEAAARLVSEELKRSLTGDVIEVVIAGFVDLSPEERAERVEKVKEFFGAHTARFLPDLQIYQLSSEDGQIVIPMREPKVTHPDTTAVVYQWKPNQLAPTTLYFVRAWRNAVIYGLDPSGETRVGPVLASLVTTLRESSYSCVYVEVTTRAQAMRPLGERQARVAQLSKRLELDLPDGCQLSPVTSKGGWVQQTLTFDGKREVQLMFVQLLDVDHDLPRKAAAAITFRPRERWLPGEHGHRFFPAFYHHLFDTMKRTPLLETVEKPALAQEQERSVGIRSPSNLRYVETGRTAFDNLKQTRSHALAFTGQRPSVLPRERIRSFEQFRSQLKVFFSSEAEGGFEADPRDTSFFILKLFQYLTSSPERRSDYEQLSWWTFIDGDGYGEKFQRLLQKWPQALVAMNATSADARTNGTTTVQIVLDLLRDSGYRDGILAGPTNEAWLDHWRRYLEAQGVEFIQGRLEGFQVREMDGQKVAWPRVSCFEPRHPMVAETQQPLLLPGYFLLALPAYDIARLARGYGSDVGFVDPDSDLARAAQIDTSDIFEEGVRGEPKPVVGQGNSEFRHYAGIQFYFDQDVLWLDGQVYHPSSDWGLTSVSQARFWEDKMDWEHGYRGVLSVIIADWETPSRRTGKAAHQTAPDDLAREVWSQIKDGLQGPRPLVTTGASAGFSFIPEPLYWHLDENLAYDPEQQRYYNRSPFHIVPPGKWAKLPGELNEAGYCVEHGIVLCGMYTKTFTRIPSMEAANESARHAVNAILRDSEFTSSNTACDIWNPEDREVEDFAWLKDLDRKLRQRGQPHVVEILGVDRLVREGLRGGARDPFDPVNLLWSMHGWRGRPNPGRY